MSKRKHTPEWMIARVEEYISGKGSCKSIARAYGIGYNTKLQLKQDIIQERAVML